MAIQEHTVTATICAAHKGGRSGRGELFENGLVHDVGVHARTTNVRFIFAKRYWECQKRVENNSKRTGDLNHLIQLRSNCIVESV